MAAKRFFRDIDQCDPMSVPEYGGRIDNEEIWELDGLPIRDHYDHANALMTKETESFFGEIVSEDLAGSITWYDD